MNICFLNDISVLGGGEHWVLRMVRWLESRGHRAFVACPYRSALFGACLDEGIDVHAYQFAPGVPFEEPLAEFLRSRAADVIYCTVIGRLCEAAMLSDIAQSFQASEGCRPLVILKTGLPPMHGLSAEYYGFGAAPPVRRLHVVSEQNRREFIAWQSLNGDGADYVATFPEGVDIAKFAPGRFQRGEERKRWGFKAGDAVATCAARLHPHKGQDNLLLAFAETREQHPSLRLVLAGEGGQRERLMQLSRHLGLDECVTFAGEVKDMPSLLAASDIFCHPSLADGFPNAVGEAMAMGLSVIATRVGGVPDVVEHGRNGLLVDAHDIHGLARRLGELASNPARRQALGAEAAATAVRVLDFDRRSAAWLEALEEEKDLFAGPSVRRNGRPPPVRAAAYPVLFVLNALRTGGEETELAILARYLDRSDFPLSVLTLYEVGEPSPARGRLQQLGVPIDTRCHALGTLEEKALCLADKIRREKIRLAVACQDVAAAYMAFEAISPGECRLIEHAGIVDEAFRVPKDRTARLVGVSPAIRDAAAARFADPSRALYLPSMVDFAEFENRDRHALRTAYGFSGQVIALFAGRLDAKKGIGFLIDAAEELLPRHPDLRFLIVGPPDAFQLEYAAGIMKRAASLFDSERFTFAGARDDVASIMCASDLLVLPSRGEGMSHVINEAGAARLPVIAFDDGAAGRQLCGGQAGVLVEAGDQAGFTQAIEELVTDAARRSRLGEALRLHVFRNYSAHRVVEKWQQLLREIAEGLPKAPAPAVIRRHAAQEAEFPAEIQIETNTACNARCIMCPYPEVSKELPHGRMPRELYEKILADCAGEKSLWRIEPFLNNEPFTDKRMTDLIALTKQQLPHVTVTVTTNGSLLKPALTDRLVKTGLDGIWFSFNGATKETYEKIMGLKFDVVKRNIDYLLSVKPETLRVYTNMIETQPMRGEIAENIRYWQSRGVQSGSSPLVNRAGNVRNFAELNYKTVNPKAVRLCDLLYRKMYIGYNGDVLLCCMDWRRQVVLGNMKRQSIREVWQGEAYQHYRRLHVAGKTAELDLCNDCSYVKN